MWKTERRSCVRCHVGFDLSADEQKFWYEDLGIPLNVRINQCLECRQAVRGRRRLMARLSELAPGVDRGEADEKQMRELVLVTAEAMTHAHPRSDLKLIRGQASIIRAVGAGGSLRHRNACHDDLMPLLIRMQEALENRQRVARLTLELAKLRSEDAALDRACRRVEAWMQAPTLRQMRQILDAHRPTRKPA